jgi:hypothetical protein
MDGGQGVDNDGGGGGLKSIKEMGNRGRRSNGGKGTENNGGGRGFKSIWERELIDGEGRKRVKSLRKREQWRGEEEGSTN